jgi:hypothetical protein
MLNHASQTTQIGPGASSSSSKTSPLPVPSGSTSRAAPVVATAESRGRLPGDSCLFSTGLSKSPRGPPPPSASCRCAARGVGVHDHARHVAGRGERGVAVPDRRQGRALVLEWRAPPTRRGGPRRQAREGRATRRCGDRHDPRSRLCTLADRRAHVLGRQRLGQSRRRHAHAPGCAHTRARNRRRDRRRSGGIAELRAASLRHGGVLGL